jgi:hypothetical protein
LPVFRVKSPAFDDGQEMAQKYGKEAGNVSRRWSGRTHRKGQGPSPSR